MIKIGDKAPSFFLPDQDGKIHKLSQYKGKKVLLYFYPRDMTPGCTVEACKFRDDYESYAKKGVILLGISNDTVESHRKFADKEKLPFPLLADTDKKMSMDYGTYQEKSFMGKKYMGIKRMTFLIDEKGLISKIYDDVKVDDHSKEILDGLLS